MLLVYLKKKKQISNFRIRNTSNNVKKINKFNPPKHILRGGTEPLTSVMTSVQCFELKILNTFLINKSLINKIHAVNGSGGLSVQIKRIFYA